jgi:hypothetical protein
MQLFLSLPLLTTCFGTAETPDDGRLRSKHVVKGRNDRNNCISDGIVLCIKNQRISTTENNKHHSLMELSLS